MQFLVRRLLIKVDQSNFTYLLLSFLLFSLCSCRLNDNRIRGTIGGRPSQDPPSHVLLSPPSLITGSELTETLAFFTSTDSLHDSFECRLNLGTWFSCESPLAITAIGSKRGGSEGLLEVRSLNGEGDFSLSTDKPYFIGDAPKGFNGTIEGSIAISGSKRLFFGSFSAYQPEVRSGLALINSQGESLYTPVNGFDGAQIYTVVHELDISGKPTGALLVSGNFTKYRNQDVPDGLIRVGSDGVWDSTFNGGGTGGTVGQFIQELSTTGLPTGKIIISLESSSTYNGLTVPAGLIRLLSDGTVDASFNNGGAGFSFSLIHQILVDRDTSNLPTGKIYVIGLFGSYNGVTKNGIIRILSDGTPDPSWFPTPAETGPSSGWLNSAVLEYNPATGMPTGKLIVTGNFGSFNSFDCPDSIVRISSSGVWDNTFNNGGSGGWGIGVGANNRLLNEKDSNNQFTGKLIYTGALTDYNGIATGKVFRINSDGSLDGGFDPGGSGLGISSTGEYGTAMAMEMSSSGFPTGKILIGGRASQFNGVPIPTNLVRLNTTGTIDTFLNNCCGGFDDTVSGITAQLELSGLPTGKHWYSGSFKAFGGETTSFGISVIDSKGELDGGFNFGQTGIYSSGTAAVLQSVIAEKDNTGASTGKFIIGGHFSHYNGVDVPDEVIRINSDGSLDPGFNSSGIGFGYTVSLFPVFLLPELNTSGLPTGKTYVGGSFTLFNGLDVSDGLVRINADGSLDNGFNNAGSGFGGSLKVVSTIAHDLNPSSGLPTGKIIVGGNFSTYNGGSVPHHLVRLNENGGIDSTFNNAGAGFGGLSENVFVIEPEFASQGLPTGKYWVGGAMGSTYNGVSISSNLVRINGSGSLDGSFNNSGTGTNSSVFTIKQIREPNGAYSNFFLVGGSINVYNSNSVPTGLIKLDKDGNLVNTFNSGQLGFENGNLKRLVQLQSQAGQFLSKFLVTGGFKNFNGKIRPSVVVIDSDGLIDESYFGNIR